MEHKAPDGVLPSHPPLDVDAHRCRAASLVRSAAAVHISLRLVASDPDRAVAFSMISLFTDGVPTSQPLRLAEIMDYHLCANAPHGGTRRYSRSLAMQESASYIDAVLRLLMAGA
jgi:hypothetical protein